MVGDYSKNYTIDLFVDALLSFVNILDYVQEYVHYHEVTDGDFEELYDTLKDCDQIYLKRIAQLQDERVEDVKQ